MKRAFLYGDLLFETIRVQNGKICYAPLHVKRLNIGFEVLQADTTITQNEFEQLITDALQGRQNARVRLVAYRDSAGFYLPQQNNMAFHVEVFDLPQQQKTISKAGIFETYKKSCNALSNLKSGNALLSVIAAKYAQQQGWDDAIILNEKGNVCEAVSSNIFIINDNSIYTPPLAEGCVMGVMREYVLTQSTSLTGDSRLNITEKEITVNDLLQADEIFFTNTIHGIMPVIQLQGKTFGTQMTEVLMQRIS